MFEPVILSLKVAAIATIIAFFLGVFFAYLLTKKNEPARTYGRPYLFSL